MDRAVSAVHPAGQDWLIAAGGVGDQLVALAVQGPPVFQSERQDGSFEDPIADAARMAGRQPPRERISRDDLIAHLMLGFWVHRCAEALASDPGLDVWNLVAANQAAPLDDGDYLAKLMSGLLRTRNRVAHHEPLMFRAKHVFNAKSGEPKTPAELVPSLQDAIPPFLTEVDLAVTTAQCIAPDASRYLDSLPDKIRAEIAPLEAKLTLERQRLREAREVRLAAAKAKRAADRQTPT